MDDERDDIVHQMASDADHQGERPLCETCTPSQRILLGSIDGVTCEECLRWFRRIEII